MADLKLDADGDLDLAEHRLSLVRGRDETDQRLKIRFRFFRGDWFLNRNAGAPYHRHLLRKRPDPIVVRALFRRIAESVRGVLQVDAVAIELDGATRNLTARIEGLYTDGSQLQVTSGPLFPQFEGGEAP